MVLAFLGERPSSEKEIYVVLHFHFACMMLTQSCGVGYVHRGFDF